MNSFLPFFFFCKIVLDISTEEEATKFAKEYALSSGYWDIPNA